MAIVDHKDWDLSEKGKKDASRHREKIDEHIRKNIKDVISEESIITKKAGKKVKIPVKGLKDYRFVYGNDGKGGGVGQGEGEPGDVVGRRHKPGQDGEEGKAGNKPGEDYMETEVDIDYLIDIMFDDLGLPYIEEKTKAKQLVPKGWKFETVSKKGTYPRIHKKRTFKESIKRTEMFSYEIMEETGCDKDDAYRALTQGKGDIEEAIRIIKDDELDKSIDPNIYIEDDDLRFKQIEEDVELHSNAVVLAMMDVSGSMTTKKKYLARSMLFWLVEFLKKTYEFVEIRFITHTTEAKLVDEHEFFYKGESGGTMCHTAFDKANYLIDTQYPVDEWNVYSIYISDGEDFTPDKTMTSVQQMIDKKVNMVGYCEICMEDGFFMPGGNTLIKDFQKKFQFDRHYTELGTDFYKNGEKRLLCCVIKNKKHVYPALKHFLFEKRKK
jgi:hypothetical protein